MTVEDRELSFLVEKEGEEEDSTELRDYMFNLLSRIKDKRIKKIFELRYFGGEGRMTWTVISDKVNVSSQTAINLHNKGLSILKKKMKKESPL